MSYDFNADDVFEMAEQIEKNGAVFYRQAAADVADPDAKSFLLNLAAMEDDHQQTFADMRKELGSGEKAATVFDPANEAADAGKIGQIAIAQLEVRPDTPCALQEELKGAIFGSIFWCFPVRMVHSGQRVDLLSL